MGAFSMASMTDVIFLLLIFFMVVSTLVVPNAIKVNLPSSRSVAAAESIMARITITKEGKYYLSIGQGKPQEIAVEMLPAALAEAAQTLTEPRYAALYADEEVPYREIVKILNVTNEMDIQLLLATKALKD